MKIDPITIEPTAQALTSEQTTMLRCASRPRSAGAASAAALDAAFGRSGSSTKRQIRNARTRPGMPATKNAACQS